MAEQDNPLDAQRKIDEALTILQGPRDATRSTERSLRR